MRDNGRIDPGSETGSPAVRDDDGERDEPQLKLRLFAVSIAAAIVLIDQVTKWWASSELAAAPIVVVEGWFQFRLTYNTGASFSLFSGGGQFIAVIVIGVIGMILYILRDANRRLEATALGLILGGAVGNLLDRVFRGSGLLDGAVVDFIDFSFFPTFNVADMAINIGLALLVIAAVWRRS